MTETTHRFTKPPAPASLQPMAVLLPERALIAVTGKDVAHFLNGLVTANIEALLPGKATPAALLTPQGKMIAEFLVLNASDEDPLYLIDVRSGFAEALEARLGFYKLRAEVTIGLIPGDVAVMAVLDGPEITGETFYSFADPRDGRLGQRLYGPRADLLIATDGMLKPESDAYHARRVRVGIPEGGPDFIPLDTFPHEALLDQTGGVDFRKGCYIGQEVVSRMEHRGSARTRAVLLSYPEGFGALAGAEIRAGDRSIGKVGEAHGGRAIGILRIDRLDDALKAGEALSAGGVPVEVLAPDFVRFPVPVRQA